MPRPVDMEIPREPMNERVLDDEWSKVVWRRATCKMPHEPVQAFSQNMWTKQAKVTHHPYPPSGLGGASVGVSSTGALSTASWAAASSFGAGFSDSPGLADGSDWAMVSGCGGAGSIPVLAEVVVAMIALNRRWTAI